MTRCGIKKKITTGSKIAECPREPELVSSEGERYEDLFLLLIFPAWPSVKRWVPGEMKATEEGRKVKNQDAVNLGMKRWPEDSVKWRGSHGGAGCCCYYAGGVTCSNTPSSRSPAENTLSSSFLSIFVK